MHICKYVHLSLFAHFPQIERNPGYLHTCTNTAALKYPNVYPVQTMHALNMLTCKTVKHTLVNIKFVSKIQVLR